MKQKVTKPKLDAAAPIKPEPKVKTHWRPVGGKPSPLWGKLWSKLLINRKEKAAGTRSPADRKGYEEGE